jgi:hypothetical protein
MGIKSDTLLRNYRILQKFTRSDSTNEGYFSLAMTVADCMHISKKHYYQHAHLIERCIAKISRKEERNDSYGFAARKLCMRTEAEPADDTDLMELAESLLPKITNNLDKIITHIQLGIAKALRHDVEGAKKHFDLCAAMTERASEQTKCVTDSHLFRAYVISGFTSEAYAMEHELKERFRDICDSGHLRANIIQQESSSLRIKIPKILENVAKELRHMEDAYIDTILSSFIPAARLSKNRYYIDEAKKMTYQILSGYTKFNLYNQISVGYAEINCPDKALNTLYLGIKDLEHAHKKIIPRKLFPDIGISCAQNYFHTSDERFIDTLLQYAHVFRIKGYSLTRACYEFCSTMAALAKDKKWNLACYVHYAD